MPGRLNGQIACFVRRHDGRHSVPPGWRHGVDGADRVRHVRGVDVAEVGSGCQRELRSSQRLTEDFLDPSSPVQVAKALVSCERGRPETHPTEITEPAAPSGNIGPGWLRQGVVHGVVRCVSRYHQLIDPAAAVVPLVCCTVGGAGELGPAFVVATVDRRGGRGLDRLRIMRTHGLSRLGADISENVLGPPGSGTIVSPYATVACAGSTGGGGALAAATAVSGVAKGSTGPRIVLRLGRHAAGVCRRRRLGRRSAA